MADFNFLLETRLTAERQAALQALQQISRSAGLNLYLTGGPLRDLILGRPVRFLDITTEGNPVPLREALRAAGAERMSVVSEQHSLRLTLRGGRVRITAAHAAGSLKPGTIIEDLRGRGITVNSIGLSLNPSSRGLPLDPTNGQADLEARLIRMNHPYVFLEQPMMLLRAVRLQTRLQFEIEDRTQARMESAREANYLENASDLARGQELEAIAYEPDPAAVLRALEHQGWLEAAFGKGVRTGKMKMAALARFGAALEAWEPLGFSVDSGLVAVALMLCDLAPADQRRLAGWLPSRHLAEWKDTVAAARHLEKRLLGLNVRMPAALGPIQDLLESAAPEAVLLAGLLPGDAKAAKKLNDFQTAAQLGRQRLPLNVLRGLDVSPASELGERILRSLHRRILSGEALTDAQLAEEARNAILAARPPVRVPPPEPERPARRGPKPGARKAAQPPVEKSAPPKSAPPAAPEQRGGRTVGKKPAKAPAAPALSGRRASGVRAAAAGGHPGRGAAKLARKGARKGSK